MLKRELGLSDETSEDEILSQIANGTIQPDSEDYEGNFNWFFGYQHNKNLFSETTVSHESQSQKPKIPKSRKKPEQDPGKAKKFQFLANMGLLDDNEILSNKLINIYGKRLFNLIHDKSRAVDTTKGFRKRVSIALGLAHDTFSDNKRIDMHLCSFMVQKIRAIQELDTLLNISIDDFNKHFPAVIKAVRERINDLENAIPPNGSESYINDIYKAEREEIVYLQHRLAKLEKHIQELNNKDVYHRNDLLQSWQKRVFRHFNYQFKIHEGRAGLNGKEIANVFENVSNSNTYIDAEYAIQEHIYSERQPITSTQLWMVDDSNCGNVLNSKNYSHNSTQRKELLLGACIAEEVANSQSDRLNCIDQIEEDTLREARDLYQLKKADLKESSLNAKKHRPHAVKRFFKSAWSFIKPESREKDTFLSLTSREIPRFFRHLKIQVGMRDKLDRELKDALASLNTIINETPEEKVDDDFLQTRTPNNILKNFQHAPLPNPASPLIEDDPITAALDFVNTFALFWDRDLMAKRPFVSMLFFSIPFMQIALPVISSTGFLANITSFFLAAEANIAKYSGLNALLQLAGQPNLTAANIKGAIDIIRDNAQWFTMAEDPVERVLLGMVVAKLTYNIGDALTNGIFGDKDSVLISEYLTTLFPGVSGSLEGKTTADQLMGLSTAILGGTLRLGLSAYTVGTIEHLFPWASFLLSKLANVPWEPITNPHISDIRVLQSIGVSKAAATILFKMHGILTNVLQGQLIDIDGHRVTEKSDSFKVLTLFNKLTHSSSKQREKLIENFNQNDPKAFKVARKHFEELLSHNPSLWEAFKNQDGSYTALIEMDVKKIAPKRRHKFIMGAAKTIPAAIKAGLGLVPGLFITLPSLIWSAISGKAPHEFVPEKWKPLYRYGLGSLNLLVKAGKLAWTFAKAVAHSFASFTVRLPEIVCTLPLFALSIALIPLRVIAWPFARLCKVNNPFTWANKAVVKANAFVSSAIRENFRYPVEEGASWVLRQCRNVFVRKVEREVQVFAAAEPKGSLFDVLKTLKAQRDQGQPASENKGKEERPVVIIRTPASEPTADNSMRASVSEHGHFSKNSNSKSKDKPVILTRKVTFEAKV